MGRIAQHTTPMKAMLKNWMLAGAVSALATVGFSAPTTAVEIVERLAPDETLGREISADYQTFQDRHAALRAVRSIQAEAAKLGIAKIVLRTPVLPRAMGRPLGSTMITNASGTFSRPQGIELRSGRVVGHEVVKVATTKPDSSE
ncbi:MAG: hypothetical protein C0518_13390 [Opitutus sp.]|nr:hypothetical protein [Opitutus sp.]